MTTHAPLSYAHRLDACLAKYGRGDGEPDVPAIFHAVRNIPYASRGSRSPADTLAANEGSCSGKHLLLRDLLQRAGERADIETVEGDFAAGLPEVATMPERLRAWVRSGGIRDFHQYVVWSGAQGELRLDATWPDFLAPLGFRTNKGWNGSGDTVLALTPRRVTGRVEDLVPYKERLLAGLSETEVKDRLEFLSLLTEWLAVANREGGHHGQ